MKNTYVRVRVCRKTFNVAVCEDIHMLQRKDKEDKTGFLELVNSATKYGVGEAKWR